MKIRDKLLLIIFSSVILSIFPISMVVIERSETIIVKNTYAICNNLSESISNIAREELFLNKNYDGTQKVIHGLNASNFQGLHDVFIINIDGKYVVDFKNTFVGKSISDLELEYIKSIQALSYREITLDGITFLRFTYPIFLDYEEHNFKIGAAVFDFNKELLFSAVSQIRNQIYLLSGTILFVILIIGAIFALSFTKPIHVLTQGVKVISQGNLDFRIKIGGLDEIGELASEFNSMTQKIQVANSKLKNLNENLELKVEERTFELNKAREQAEIEKSIAQIAQQETEKAKEETEKLNELMKNVNSVSSLIDIMSFIMYYLETEYNFNDYCLLLNDDDKVSIIPFSFTSPHNTSEVIESFMKLKFPHSELSGVFAEILENRKPIYIEKENIPKEDTIAKKWIEKGNFDYLLLIPLVIYDELIGILFLHSPRTTLTITEDIRIKLERFSDLIAGSIFNARLLKKVEEAKEQADIQKEKAVIAQTETEKERQKSEKLLLNILPEEIAKELKEKGVTEPELFESVSVLFTDFKGFTTIAEKLTPQELVGELDRCFSYFDALMERYNLEKLKTIGDSYMCAGGIPKRNKSHAIDATLAALEIQSIMNTMKSLKESVGVAYWELRLGIHTGPLVAGVIGEKKFAYDVWGDTVNTASRMESSGTPGKINISGATYKLVKDFFDCEYRGMVNAKNKGEIEMYYVHGIQRELSTDEDGRTPNEKFFELMKKI